MLADWPSLPSLFGLSWWRGATLNGIVVAQSFLFLLSPSPVQPQDAEESVQHLYKGPLTQRSEPLRQGGVSALESDLGVVQK